MLLQRWMGAKLTRFLAVFLFPSRFSADCIVVVAAVAASTTASVTSTTTTAVVAVIFVCNYTL